ncbi:MAG: hypothetical protein COB98_02370 [Flavobacteriaceae bacterium]|nr:MAG: hypothetical protein COB98_02370 [Flavobacteriaceae bacterium]
MDRRKVLKTMGFALGATIAAPTLLQLFSACKLAPENTWTPLFLSVKRGAILVKISQTILPIPESPVIQEEIPRFIDLILNEVISPADQTEFLKGAAAFETEFEEKFNTSTHTGSLLEYTEILSDYFRGSNPIKAPSIKVEDKAAHPPLTTDKQRIYKYLLFIRKYTIWGYATSREFSPN